MESMSYGSALESQESGNRVSEADVSWGRVLGTTKFLVIFFLKNKCN